MDRLSSSTSTVSIVNDYFEQNMWNPLLELLFLEHTYCIVDSYLVKIDLANIRHSCHFALDLLCYRRRCSSLSDDTLGTIARGIPHLVWRHCIPCNIDVLQSKAGFRTRLLAGKVFVCDWKMVPKVHPLMEVGLAMSYTVHCAIFVMLHITSTLVLACLST